MSPRSAASLRVITDPRPPPVLPSAVLGTLFFIFSEVMLFAGLVSAYSITRSEAVSWPPPGQPRLPAEQTAINTLALLVSGPVLWWAGRLFQRGRDERTNAFLTAAIGLGAFFVAFQGSEWLGMIRQGLTLTSSAHGGFFYLIVGMHALHAVGALAALGMVWTRLRRGRLSRSTFAAARTFWYFVVVVWPFLYATVYF